MPALSRLRLKNFTAFSDFNEELSNGLNVIIGENGTGKTHLLKVLYAASAITAGHDKERSIASKLQGVFSPYEGRMTRLIRRQQGLPSAEIQVSRSDDANLRVVIDNMKASVRDVKVLGVRRWLSAELISAYIPVKEMLSHAPGFISTVEKREMAFEEVYVDIVRLALLPKLRGAVQADRRRLLESLQKCIQGRVEIKGEHFFLKSGQGALEFTLLAEGMRKLALIWILIQNGTLTRGAFLFWDEPEANINPQLLGEVASLILQLQRMGVQIFIATHSYVLLKEIDLRRERADKVRFFSLRRQGPKGQVVCQTSTSYAGVVPNPISESFSSIYDRELRKVIGKTQ